MSSLCTESFNFDVDLLAVSAMASLMILAVAYIVYRIWGDEKIKIWVKQELWNLVMNGIIIIVLMGFISWFQSSITSSTNIDNFMQTILLSHSLSLSSSDVQGACLYETAYDYGVTLISKSLEQYAVSSWAIVHFLYLTKITKMACASDNFLVCLLGAPSVYVTPFADLEWATSFLYKINQVMFTTVLLFAFSQVVLINLFLTSHFFNFLALMIIMRLIPFTRTFANVIFALIFAFFIFYPMLIVLEAYILGIPEPHSSSIAAGSSFSDTIIQASRLSGLRYGEPQDTSELMGDDIDEIWKIGGDSSDVVLYKNNDVIINLSLLIADYSRFLFAAVLFGSVNLIVVSLVVKSLLHFLGESNNLMEMFIRMSGIITW